MWLSLCPLALLLRLLPLVDQRLHQRQQVGLQTLQEPCRKAVTRTQ
jgi:hypothetical protein